MGYLTAGFPTRDRFREHLLAIASAADVVEIGVPFTDPMADGMTIQRASHVALQAGVTLPWILEQLSSLKPRPAAPLLLMSYLNPLLRVWSAASRCGRSPLRRSRVHRSRPSARGERGSQARFDRGAGRIGADGHAGHAAGAPPGSCVPQVRGSSMRSL